MTRKTAGQRRNEELAKIALGDVERIQRAIDVLSLKLRAMDAHVLPGESSERDALDLALDSLMGDLTRAGMLRQKWITRARECARRDLALNDDDSMVDPDAEVDLVLGDGAWVSARVWVPWDHLQGD